MCGIAGSISFKRDKKIQKHVLEKMSEKIINRGPDGNGICLIENERIGMVHRRLAIVDLSENANQPMRSEDGNISIVFNGEIYNHADIREEINKVKNINWKTDHSDTEVIIYAYAIWGIKCIEKFRGMFAFSLWDASKKKMYLVRDRLGIKPLYYGFANDKLNFSSTLAALLEDSEQSREIDKVAMYDYLSLLAVPAPKTLFKNIKKISAGHYLEINLEGKIKDICYWDICEYANAEKSRAGEEELKHKLLELLKESTNIRKMADVPIGVFLSGGVDSSTNLALFAEDGNQTNTFTVGYIGTRNYQNENKYAKQMAKYCNSIHHDKILGEQDVLNFINTLKKMSDDPIADPVMVSQYYIAKLARDNGIKVVQVGEGADELFAGYSYWKQQAQYEKWNVNLPNWMKRVLYDMVQKEKIVLEERKRELLRRAAKNESIFWGSGMVYIGEDEKKKLFDKKFLASIGTHETWDNFKDAYRKCKKTIKNETVSWMACVNMQFRLPELLLARTDRACMAVGVEGRVPFLDHKLVEWGMRIPEKKKIVGDEHKYILKQTVKGIIPDSVIYRKKVGFGLPFIEWYKSDLGKTIKKSIKQFAKESKFFNEKEIRKILSSRNTDPTEIWALFILSLWWEEYGSK